MAERLTEVPGPRVEGRVPSGGSSPHHRLHRHPGHSSCGSSSLPRSGNGRRCRGGLSRGGRRCPRLSPVAHCGGQACPSADHGHPCLHQSCLTWCPRRGGYQLHRPRAAERPRRRGWCRCQQEKSQHRVEQLRGGRDEVQPRRRPPWPEARVSLRTETTRTRAPPGPCTAGATFRRWGDGAAEPSPPPCGNRGRPGSKRPGSG